MPKQNQDFPPTAFVGFRPDAMDFFRGLAANQTKAWYEAHKPDYERFVREPLSSLIVDLSESLRTAGVPLQGDPSRSLFRLHRDIRFSKDKRPYKTHAGAVLTRDGTKGSPGLLYLHFDPAGSFVAAGFYQPEPPQLLHMRQHLAANPAVWRKIEANLKKSGLSAPEGEAAARLPRGFEKAPEAIADALKLKSWIVRRTIPEAELGSPDLAAGISAFAKAAQPLLAFGWDALK